MSAERLKAWDLFLIVWWPHSGCRWLNRSLLSRHPDLATGEYVHPFLTHSADMLLSLDRTSQVHKARSMPDLSEEFDILWKSTQEGRRAGLETYFAEKLRMMGERFPGKQYGGVLSPGAPEPLPVDLELMFEVVPSARIVHLVRHPYDCFLSMKSRAEMDADPYKIAGSWTAINAMTRGWAETLGPERYILVRYEDLVRDTETELRRLCGWIGVPYDPEMLSDTDHYHGRNKKVDLGAMKDNREFRVLWSLTEAEAKEYGYEEAGAESLLTMKKAAL